MIISVAKADHVQDGAVMCMKKEKFFCDYQQALWQSNLLLSVSLQVTERWYWKQHSSGILHWSPFQRKFCFLGKNYRQSMYATELFVFISKTTMPMIQGQFKHVALLSATYRKLVHWLQVPGIDWDSWQLTFPTLTLAMCLHAGIPCIPPWWSNFRQLN